MLYFITIVNPKIVFSEIR